MEVAGPNGKIRTADIRQIKNTWIYKLKVPIKNEMHAFSTLTPLKLSS